MEITPARAKTKAIGVRSSSLDSFSMPALNNMPPTAELCDCQICELVLGSGKDMLGAMEEYVNRLYDEKHAARTRVGDWWERVETDFCAKCGTLRAAE